MPHQTASFASKQRKETARIKDEAEEAAEAAAEEAVALRGGDGEGQAGGTGGRIDSSSGGIAAGTQWGRQARYDCVRKTAWKSKGKEAGRTGSAASTRAKSSGAPREP